MKEKRLYLKKKEINCCHRIVVGIILVGSYRNTQHMLSLHMPTLLKLLPKTC